MLATTMGIVVPVPSAVVRSTSNREVTSEWLGTTKTSSYVRSYGGRCPSRNFICEPYSSGRYASTSLRSPLQSVWNLPGASMRS
ncbi:Uncharacterised protein [Mycobacteroides abscessus]|nr:Uncharacterised protein [Mycobacteroides abscessus]